MKVITTVSALALLAGATLSNAVTIVSNTGNAVSGSNLELSAANSPIRASFNTGNAPAGGTGWDLNLISFPGDPNGGTVTGLEYRLLAADGSELGLSQTTTASNGNNIVAFFGQNIELAPNTSYTFEIDATNATGSGALRQTFNGSETGNPGATIDGVTAGPSNAGQLPVLFNVDGDVVAVPEPGSALLLGLAGLTVGLRRRR